MHDSTIQAGDDWLENNLSSYIEYVKTHNSLFILTFDEGNYEEDGDHILTLIIGNHVAGGIYDENIFHHMLLRTIEDMYDLDHAGNAANVDPIYDCWK
jgi:acid phosphatase